MTEQYNDQLRELREAGLAEQAEEVREALRALRDEERAPESSVKVYVVITALLFILGLHTSYLISACVLHHVCSRLLWLEAVVEQCPLATNIASHQLPAKLLRATCLAVAEAKRLN